jgi:hypothetical protein
LHAENLRYAGWLARQLNIDADVDAAGSNPSRLSVQARQVGRGSPLIDQAPRDRHRPSRTIIASRST